MFSFVKNAFYLIVCLLLLEACIYYKDYNEVVSFSNYIKYDYRHKKIESFSNDKYEVCIDGGKVSVIYYRDSIFNFKFFKKIEYHGII